jgi:hypothetical protein
LKWWLVAGIGKDQLISKECSMSSRYNVVNVPHSEMFALELGQSPPSKPIQQSCFRVEDSLADGDYIGGPYLTKDEAMADCDKLNRASEC